MFPLTREKTQTPTMNPCVKCGLLFLCFSFSAVATQPRQSYLTHASRQIHVEGESRGQIQKRWGTPQSKLAKNFREPKYRWPAQIPLFNEQWVYTLTKQMGWRLVYFNKGRVVLCVEEWSDF
jgi:hypothetical protein